MICICESNKYNITYGEYDNKIGFIRTDKNKIITYVSDEWVDITGYKKQDVINKRTSEILQVVDLDDDTINKMSEHIENGTSYN